MIFHRFEDDGLAHYAYAVGSEATGTVAVVDPGRDLDRILAWARETGVRIEHVLETHIHADYASGARTLTDRTGAPLHLSAYDRGERYDVGFPHRPMEEGDEVALGGVRLRAVHTPGHTPEHIAFLVYDDGAAEADGPVRFLTGDFLFIGSLGRPDLLGEDAKRALAGAMYDTVGRVLPGLPDDLMIHPAHGSGSMCGAGMSGETVARSLGEERAANPFLDPSLDRETFIDRLLATAPPFPDYYVRMKERNSGGPGHGRPWPEPVALDPAGVAERAADGAVVVDTRHQLAFGGGHIPGAFGIGLGPDLSTWGAWVLPYDRPLLLVTDGDDVRDAVAAAVRRLARVGLDRVDGYLAGGMDPWIQEAGALESLVQWAPRTVAEALGDGLRVLDVRTDEEWREGHIDGALHIMGGDVQDALDGNGAGPGEGGDRLPDRDAELAVICGSGYRSTVVASVLQRAGYRRVRNVPGGMDAWRSAGLPVVAASD